MIALHCLSGTCCINQTFNQWRRKKLKVKGMDLETRRPDGTIELSWSDQVVLAELLLLLEDRARQDRVLCKMSLQNNAIF